MHTSPVPGPLGQKGYFKLSCIGIRAAVVDGLQQERTNDEGWGLMTEYSLYAQFNPMNNSLVTSTGYSQWIAFNQMGGETKTLQ